MPPMNFTHSGSTMNMCTAIAATTVNANLPSTSSSSQPNCAHSANIRQDTAYGASLMIMPIRRHADLEQALDRVLERLAWPGSASSPGRCRSSARRTSRASFCLSSTAAASTFFGHDADSSIFMKPSSCWPVADDLAAPSARPAPSPGRAWLGRGRAPGPIRLTINRPMPTAISVTHGGVDQRAPAELAQAARRRPAPPRPAPAPRTSAAAPA